MPLREASVLALTLLVEGAEESCADFLPDIMGKLGRLVKEVGLCRACRSRI